MQHREETGEPAGRVVLRSVKCACAHVATSGTKSVKSQANSEAMWDITADDGTKWDQMKALMPLLCQGNAVVESVLLADCRHELPCRTAATTAQVPEVLYAGRQAQRDNLCCLVNNSKQLSNCLTGSNTVCWSQLSRCQQILPAVTASFGCAAGMGATCRSRFTTDRKEEALLIDAGAWFAWMAYTPMCTALGDPCTSNGTVQFQEAARPSGALELVHW